MGRVGARLDDAGDLPVLEAVEDGGVLGAGDALGHGDDRIEIQIGRAARGVVELEDLHREVGADLDERLVPADGVRDPLDRPLVDVLEAPGVDAAERPAVRSREVDQLASREVELEDAPRLVVDLRPGLGRDRARALA